MIGIRADANSIIATGHMMRCLTIAKAIEKQGESVTFFMADEESERLFMSFCEGRYESVVLGTDYRDMESELEVLEKELAERDIEVLLVDSYSVTKNYFDELSKVCRTAYLDDLAKEAYSVDLLINYSGYSENMGYNELYTGIRGHEGQETKLLLGLLYAPLREQFYSDTENHLNSNSGRVDILLATGGADMCNMISGVLDKALSEGLLPVNESLSINWHVVVGDFVENPAEVEHYAQKSRNVVIHRSVKDMAGLMRACNLAVLAAGTMLTECAACGLPAIFYQVADNQKYNVEYFGKLEGMIFAGAVHSGEEEKALTIESIIDEVKRMIGDRDRMAAMGDSLFKITDGRGAVRIAKALMEEV
ncbi:MAG: UDP-2,4-diacetamido-2,4,6-trideoxy-beta-L-altropyranose hydrolase [Butyrivibrio sp.]|nr:UDP-2,4-diacetamido-2,4,6-trideoxy-beta-L-altropyranose hydrolase [Butyrivibrio sp.]